MTDFRPLLRRFPPLADRADAAVQPAETLPVLPMAGGLINDTFALGSGFVLQRLHRIFAAEVNLDIAALVPPLQAAGVPVPTILRARDGRPWVAVDPAEDPDLAGVWRILTRLPGVTLHKLPGEREARSAGALAARFHGALADFEHAFAFSRPGAHDTRRHMRLLREAVAAHPDHRLAAQVRPLADELDKRWQRFGALPDLPRRIVHGDLKVSNLLFSNAGDAIALLDLDTMAHGTLDVELGDALRSWANPAAEDDRDPHLDPAIFLAAMQGYLQVAAPWLTAAEIVSVPAGVERICLELAARFAADALNEAYFGWDPARAPGRGEHNLLRARNQLGLARSVADQQARLQRGLIGLARAANVVDAANL